MIRPQVRRHNASRVSKARPVSRVRPHRSGSATSAGPDSAGPDSAGPDSAGPSWRQREPDRAAAHAGSTNSPRQQKRAAGE
jgi:hypothetical protein